MQRSLTILNERGDVTIVWDAANDDEMEKIIEKKMKEGISFFILTPRLGGIASPDKSPLRDAADARRYRALAIPDAEFSKFVEDGNGEMVPTPPEKVKTVRKAETAKEVAQAQSVGVKPLRGG